MTQTVLVVDDDLTTLATEARFLHLEGYRVLTAGDANSALATIDAERPDAILLDLKLPEVAHGLGVLRRIRAQTPASPLAVVTGHYALDDVTEAEIRGLGVAIAYKPLWIENVLALVRDLLGPER
jgi:DNA-binding response OmpR family regulator